MALAERPLECLGPVNERFDRLGERFDLSLLMPFPFRLCLDKRSDAGNRHRRANVAVSIV